MRRAIAMLVVLAAATLICGAACSALTWNYMMEGAVIPGPWYFQNQAANSYVHSSIIDPITLNRAVTLMDNSTSVKAQIVRPDYHSATGGITLHIRFRVAAGASAGAIGIQIPDNYEIGTGNRGHVKWAWTSGQMVVTKGTPSGSDRFSAPADTWVEVWVTIADYVYKLWVKSGSTWTLTNQGATKDGGVAAYIGSGDNAGTGAMDVDFLRFHTAGAYEPTDPNAPVAPSVPTRIGDAKVNFPIGFPVDFQNKPVTNSWTEQPENTLYNVFFIQDDDRTAGVKVRRVIQSPSEAVATGARVNVKGYLDVALKEAFAFCDGVTVAAPAQQPPVLPRPIGVLGRCTSAGQLGVQPAMSTTSYGLNNAGLRVRLSGVVTAAGVIDGLTGFPVCYVDDGSGITNDSSIWFGWTGLIYHGVKVYNAGALVEGNKVEVTGCAGVEETVLDTTTIRYPVIFCATASDVTVY